MLNCTCVSYQGNILRLFNDLRGSWRVQRKLGDVGTMQGVAHFSAWAPGVWHYEEKGWAAWGRSRRTPVQRAYAYLYNDGAIAVHFWDSAAHRPGGLLHALQFESQPDTDAWVAVGCHRCGQDTYQAMYRFCLPAHFQLTYWVRGPRKHYVLQTQLERIVQR